MAKPSVLIVGAGPAGLILAISLLQNGIPVRLIAKETQYRIGSRGAGIQPRTQELYDILGVLTDIKREAVYTPMNRIYELPEGIKPLRTFSISPWVDPTPGIPHANSLILSQERHEEILRDHLHKLSGTVELGSELIDFYQFPDHVVAQIVKDGPDGTKVTETTKFDWLVGTDGAHSIVRKQLGLSFLGETKSEAHIAVGDIVVEEGLEHEFWHMWIPRGKLMVLRPGSAASKNFMFAYSGRPEHLANNPLTRDEFVEEFYSLTGRRDIKFGDASWMSIYTPNIRMVDRFHDGRVLIAGDAAHCHSPTGGQGLNSSVQDSINLGWKLALVQKGFAPVKLLESYSAERLVVIAEMLKVTTDLYNKTAAVVRDPTSGDSAWARGGDLSMLGINYRGSSIILEDPDVSIDGGAYARPEAGRVVPGYRAPDAPGLVEPGSTVPTRLFTVFGTAFHAVLVFGGDTASHVSVGEILKRFPDGAVLSVLLSAAGITLPNSGLNKVLEDRDGHAYAGYGAVLDKLTVVVVRPDGVVGAVVSEVKGVEEYFRLIFVQA
ncbi:monooxygenase [Mycena epipterygia]|nr:monooxygenase [Mycena epipterygia]